MTDPKDKLLSHGITQGQMDKFHYNQIHNIVEKFAANRRDKITDKFWKEEFADYEVAEHDAMHYHVIQESRMFDQQSGARLTKANVQIYNEVSFNFMTKNNGFTGKLTFVIHDPKVKSLQKSKAKVEDAPSAPIVEETKPEQPNVELTSIEEGTQPEAPLAELQFADLSEARKAYSVVFGKQAYHGWDIATITEKIKTQNPAQ